MTTPPLSAIYSLLVNQPLFYGSFFCLLIIRVEDPHPHFNADPDPSFHFNADPDPTFYNNVDTDPPLHGSIFRICDGPVWLHFWASKVSEFRL
jgi:hypothetical protein